MKFQPLIELARLAVLGFSVAAAGSASAGIMNYSSEFTAAEDAAYVDGNSVNGVDGWVANANHLASDTGTFGAVRLNSNGRSLIQTGAGGSLAVGEPVTISADVFYTNAGGGNSSFRLGLTSDTDDQPSPYAAVTFRRTGLGNLNIIPEAIGGGSENGANLNNVVTGITTGQANAQTYSITVVKTATPNVFDVTWNAGVTTMTYQHTDAALYGAANVYGMMRYNGQADVTSVDSFTQSAQSVVPEPASLGLLAVTTFGLLARQRRLT